MFYISVYTVLDMVFIDNINFKLELTKVVCF